MPVDYSKWDALELSDDSDIEVHPNVDKKSFIRAKQNQIHQERQHRKHQITTLKYERIINDGMLSRIDALVGALQSHIRAATQSEDSQRSPDELVFQSLMESADPANDMPPKPPEGVHENVKEQPSYSKMIAELVDQVKKAVDESKPENRLDAYMKEIGSHRDRILDLQQQLLKKLAELEKADGSKITSESIHFGFNSSHVAKSTPAAAPSSTTKTATSTELLNPSKRNTPDLTGDSSGPSDSGFEADSEDNAARAAVPKTSSASASDDIDGPSKLGEAFGKLSVTDHRALYSFISNNPSVLSERETDGLLVAAFDAQLAGKSEEARRYVHQALLLQYCRSLGRDGVQLFFKRIAGEAGKADAKKVFYDDVNQTYARLKERAAAMAAQDAENGNGEGVEQIQLHAVNPGQSISINVPDENNQAENGPSKAIFDSFPPGLQRALRSGSLDEVNKVLGKMSVEEAEEVVGKLSEGGMLSLEEGVVDATTDEGRETLRKIEAGEVEYADEVDAGTTGPGLAEEVLVSAESKGKGPVRPVEVEEVD